MANVMRRPFFVLGRWSKRSGNVRGLTIGDANRRRRRRGVKKNPTTRGRRTVTHTFDSSIADVSTATTNIGDTWQLGQLYQFASGSTPDTRRNNFINALKLHFRGHVKWDTGGTPATRIRIVICSLVAGEDPLAAAAINAEIYGRDAYPAIKHVYMDRYVYLKSSTQTYSKLHFTVNFKGLGLHFADNLGSSMDRRQLAIYTVSDVNGATTDIVGNFREKFSEV